MKDQMVSKLKKARFVFNPKTVRQIDDAQALKIIEETGAENRLTNEQVGKLRTAINNALDWVLPRVKTPWTDVEDIREAVKVLNKKLHPGNLLLLGLIASAAEGNFRPREGSVTLHRDNAIKIARLKESLDSVSAWLADERARRIVTGSLEPELAFSSLTGHLLPTIFEMIFLEQFTTDYSSPGMNFTVAVLRESGARTPDKQGAIFEQIKKSRNRLMGEAEQNAEEARRLLSEKAKQKTRVDRS